MQSERPVCLPGRSINLKFYNYSRRQSTIDNHCHLPLFWTPLGKTPRSPASSLCDINLIIMQFAERVAQKGHVEIARARV